jgi:membrane protein DedA with SNARE-associated domain
VHNTSLLMDYLGTQILAFIESNPGWAMFVVGLTAFGESFVFLSLLFPGTTILIAAGALISAGILDPISSVIAGIVGAVLGVMAGAVFSSGGSSAHCARSSPWRLA